MNALHNYEKLKASANILDLDRERKLFDNRAYLKNYDKMVQSQGNIYDMSKYNLESKQLENRQRLLNIKLDEDLKPYGLHSGDAVWMRLIPKLLNYINPNITNFLKR